MGTNTKIYILAAASFLLQVATWLLVNSTLKNGGALGWVMTAAVAASAISVTTFFMLVNRSAWLANTLIVLSAVMYLLIFPHAPIVWFGGLVFCLFAFWYEHRIWRETKSRIDFAITRVMGGAVSILLYGILLLLGFNIYYNVSADFQAHPDKYYDRLGQQAAKTVPYFSKLFPISDNLNEPLGDYLQKQAQSNPEYGKASSFEKDILINEAKRTFQEQFQITANDNQSLAEIMAEVAVNKIRQLVAPYQNWLPLVFAILVTGLLYTFAFLIRWLILAISWALFRVLVSVGFFRLEKIQVQVEKLAI